ncbi:branched-chain amino acid ABC transporter permease [Paenibacillus dendritiformis]|uniref:branched-chain amino acid ABC transporter permease n=1 Tax=Paenibacillus dendritiformis TaxID=130049 RepID=UPI00143D1A1A|nr:branched-chain amino acid ABC transporter permease [Paenibacillus dendritiformis]NKI21660.1 branched-chain amino acid ABC transporter permease [Paenibacillus dendritiformis]NRF97956.1 branched-chain amino acid ABC transporter permease [Paenibacillus dendritiformis]
MRTNRIGTAGFLAMVAALALLPAVNDSRSFLIVMTQICIFAIFAMSYDILLGYTGIVSFGHCMFFGIGAYSSGIMLDRLGPSAGTLILSVLAGMLLSALLSYIVGMLSLRLKSHFYAMLTLAFSGLLLVLAEKWRSLTNGNDGFTFPIPAAMKDRTVLYFTALAAMAAIFLLLRRFTQSPAGRVLLAIRENEQRAESLGYAIIHYKVMATVVAGMAASLSGSLYVLTLRFVNTTVFGMDMTLSALLMTIIGGVGTLYGAIIGASLIEWAHHGLSELAKFHPVFERWIIFFGLLYIIVVLLFPAGIVGTLRNWSRRGEGGRTRDEGKAASRSVRKEEAG